MKINVGRQFQFCFILGLANLAGNPAQAMSRLLPGPTHFEIATPQTSQMPSVPTPPHRATDSIQIVDPLNPTQVHQVSFRKICSLIANQLKDRINLKSRMNSLPSEDLLSFSSLHLSESSISIASIEQEVRGLSTLPTSPVISPASTFPSSWWDWEGSRSRPPVPLSDILSVPVANLLFNLKDSTLNLIDGEHLIAMWIYLQRVFEYNPHITLTKENYFRLFATASLLSMKLWEDFPFSNSFFAKIFLHETRELNDQESEFLRLLQFDLSITPSEYEKAKQDLYLASLDF